MLISFRDISRLVFLSRFSAPSTSIYQFFPINFFCWPRNVSISSGTNLLEKVKEIVDASKFWFSKHHENNHFLPLEREDIAIWLLVSTASVSVAQHNHISSDCQTNPVRVWRLALLVKNTVILGSTLDPRCDEVYFSKFQTGFLTSVMGKSKHVLRNDIFHSVWLSWLIIFFYHHFGSSW